MSKDDEIRALKEEVVRLEHKITALGGAYKMLVDRYNAFKADLSRIVRRDTRSVDDTIAAIHGMFESTDTDEEPHN